MPPQQAKDAGERTKEDVAVQKVSTAHNIVVGASEESSTQDGALCKGQLTHDGMVPLWLPVSSWYPALPLLYLNIGT